VNVKTKEDIKEVMSQCYLSTKVTAHMLFPDLFYRPFASITDPVFAALDDPTIQKVVIKAPRGWGKTTIGNLVYPAKNILFRDKRFIVLISNTSTQAVMQSENLKMELMANKDIRKIFGSVKTNSANDSDVDMSFSKEMWVANGETLVLPRGAGQQVRGVNFGSKRPDLIVFDDVEDRKAVQSEDQRRDLKEWMFSDVLNSVERGRNDWKIVFIGTLLHEDSLLASLLADPTWHKIEIDLCDDDLNSNWPDFMSTAQVRELYETYKVQGLLDTFAREYRGQPIAKEDAVFKQEYFKDYTESDSEFTKNLSELENVVIIDPAKTTKVSSDNSAIVGIGVNVLIPRIYVRDIDAGHMHPEQIYERAFDMADRIGARTIGYEVTSLNEFITYPITTYMMKRGKFYQLIELKARGKKEDRIAMLNPLYRLGYVYHNKNVCQILEQQLMAFPKSKRDDVSDALAYVVELLELGERYFAPDTQKGDVPDKDEYASLENEYEPVIQNWRYA
jgi:hypothetical protein